MFAYHKQTLPPSGVSHAVSLRLTPSLLQSNALPGSSSRVIRNLVVARNNFLQIFEVRELLDAQRPIQSSAEGQDAGGEEAALGEEMQVRPYRP
jgi:cleavage and polyadenylation specificity factor subunit 1